MQIAKQQLALLKALSQLAVVPMKIPRNSGEVWLILCIDIVYG